jgi:hypothetical protein
MTSISFSVVISFLRSPLRQSSITMKSSWEGPLFICK